MNTYAITFVGRTVKAIGITYHISVVVCADNEEKAELQLYEDYEHISQLHIKKINK